MCGEVLGAETNSIRSSNLSPCSASSMCDTRKPVPGRPDPTPSEGDQGKKEDFDRALMNQHSAEVLSPDLRCY